MFTKFVTNDITMTTSAIRKKLTDYLKVADDKKIKAIYAMVEEEIGTLENDWDKDFINEMNGIIKSYEAGEATTYTLNEAEAIARDAYKANKKK